MPLIIPEEARQPLAQLHSLSPVQREELAVALKNAKPSLSLMGLVAGLSRIEGVDEELLPGVIGTIMSLYRLQEQTGRSAREVASDLVVALRDEGFVDLGGSEAGAQAFEDYLAHLLSFENTVGVTLKAEDISLEPANIFGSARILTDLRPIFWGKDNPEPRAMTVVHTLKIEIHDSDASFYCGLDHLDLHALKDVVERALKKEEALKQVVLKSGLTWLER